jgi:hypothetical protein
MWEILRNTGASNPCNGAYSPKCLEGVRLLKKSLSARSAIHERPETRPKHYKNGVFSP